MLALELLGPVVLRRDGAALPLTIRKTAALLVLLALGGPAPRARVVALLWPDLEEATGRRNLRRELARLREIGAFDAVLTDGDRLAPAVTLAVDATLFQHALQAGDAPSALAHWRGPLADGLDLDDAHAFMDWLAQERERLQALRRQALQGAAQAAQARGETDTALALLQQLLADDPLQEQHHRAVMQLLAASGRREAALVQYRRCCDLLRDELGLVPMADTEALAAALRGQPAGPTPAAVPVAAPGRLLPSALPFVGRQAEVQALEAAWHRGAAVLVEGLAGVGKTRLALDVAAAHGAFALVRCQPGDAELPYAAFARALQALCGQPPERAVLAAAGLAPWAIDELSRLLPGLGAPAPAIRSAEEQARFFEACKQAWHGLAAENFDVIVLDDWHLADSASLGLLTQVVRQRRESGLTAAREWLLVRPEMAADVRQRLCDGLQAVVLHLQPLDDPAVLDLVRQLSGAAQPVRFAARLQRATGGNPFFIAETLRLLADTGSLYLDDDGRWSTPFDAATEDYSELPLPPSVRDAVLARVQRLPEAARRLLEAACLAAEPWAPRMLAAACALSELEATVALEQTLDATLVREHAEGGHGFVHDLARQALEASLSPQRRRLVHRRLALAAEAAGESPALAAQHHEASGDLRRAAPLRMAAGDQAERLQDIPQAVQHWRHGLTDDPMPTVAARLHRRLMRSLRWVNQADAALAQVDALRALAQSGRLTPDERLDAWIDIAGWLARNARLSDALVVGRAEEALVLLDTVASGGTPLQQALARLYRVDALRESGRTEASRLEAHALLADPHLPLSKRADLLDALVLTEHQAGRIAEALPLLAQAEAVCRQMGDHFGTARGLYRRGQLLINLKSFDEAELPLRAGLVIARRMGMTRNTVAFLQSLCEVHQARGEMDALLAVAQEAWAPPLGPQTGLLDPVFRAAFVQGHSARGEWDAAIVHARAAVEAVLALPVAVRLQVAVYLPLEIFPLMGDVAIPARLQAELAADLAQGPDELVQAQRLHFVRCALAAGDAAGARQQLAAMPPTATLADAAQRTAWQVAEAATLLAEGQAAAALAELPADEAVLGAELQARGLAVRVAAECIGPGGLLPGTVARARRLLTQPGLHAVAARMLREALARAGWVGAD
jgi:DNA-binding SARP family transcriptional activator